MSFQQRCRMSPGCSAHLGHAGFTRVQHRQPGVRVTENPGLSRITFVVSGNDNVLKRASQQLQKIVNVVDVFDISLQDYVEHDLMLIKVSIPHGCRRSEVHELVDMCRGRIIDFSVSEALIEVSGQEAGRSKPSSS